MKRNRISVRPLLKYFQLEKISQEDGSHVNHSQCLMCSEMCISAGNWTQKQSHYKMECRHPEKHFSYRPKQPLLMTGSSMHTRMERHVVRCIKMPASPHLRAASLQVATMIWSLSWSIAHCISVLITWKSCAIWNYGRLERQNDRDSEKKIQFLYLNKWCF